MAPSVYHRLRWDQGGKADVVRIAHRLFLAGTGCLDAGIVAAVFLVSDVLFGPLAGSIAACGVGLTVLLSWYLLPARRARSPRVRDEE